MLFPIKQGLFQYDLEDYYAILGAPLDADSKQIRDRYLKIAFRLHPDTCKAQTDQERLLANQILAKLVNPAYEILSKENKRNEFQFVLSQMGTNLALDASIPSLVGDRAKQLSQADQNFDLLYHRLISPLTNQQYETLVNSFEITAQISELNLIYLIIRQGQPIHIQAKSRVLSSEVSAGLSSQPRNVQNEDKPSTEKSPPTPLENALKRAKEQMERGNYSQVVAGLQEVLKGHPHNSTGHALIGMAYLRTNQLTMAKVHINKAIAVDPTDPTAKQAQQALKKLSPQGSDSSAEKTKNGFLGSFLGKPKK